MHSVRNRVIVVNDQIVIRPIMVVGLTYVVLCLVYSQVYGSKLTYSAAFAQI